MIGEAGCLYGVGDCFLRGVCHAFPGWIFVPQAIEGGKAVSVASVLAEDATYELFHGVEAARVLGGAVGGFESIYDG